MKPSRQLRDAPFFPMLPLADVVRQHRYEHARTLLETACQEAAQLRDYFPVLKRFLCQPTETEKNARVQSVNCENRSLGW